MGKVEIKYRKVLETLKDVTQRDFDEYFETKAKPQVEEILTQYGDLCLIQNWKSAERIRRDREHLASIGANYLLNVGPDGLGRIPPPAVDVLLAAKV